MSSIYTARPNRRSPSDPMNGRRISQTKHEMLVKRGEKIAQNAFVTRRAKFAEHMGAIAKTTVADANEIQKVDVTRKRSLLKCIQEELDKREPNSIITRREKAAMAFVDEMEAGSFAHHKEILDREEGKVPSKLAIMDGVPLKAFINMPTEGEDAP